MSQKLYVSDTEKHDEVKLTAEARSWRRVPSPERVVVVMSWSMRNLPHQAKHVQPSCFPLRS